MEVTAISPPPAERRPWIKWVVGSLLTLLMVLAGVGFGIDTDAGHRLIADRIAALRPSSGLRISVGRIDGSVWHDMRIVDLRLADRRGIFLEAPAIDVDWRPLRWLDNSLEIERLAADLVILHRAPGLRSTSNGPLLPDFDVAIRGLDLRLRFEPALAGARRLARLRGSVEIRRGRALFALRAGAAAGDRLTMLLDAEPARDRFDLDARLRAPGTGILPALLGTRKGIALTIAGDGRWAVWNGRARLDVGAARVADLTLGAREGDYALAGALDLRSITQGKLQRLSGPRVMVSGEATLADRRLDGTLALRSSALALRGDGTIDLATSAFDGIRIGARLLRPAALFPNMSGQAIALKAVLDGPFRTAAFSYSLAAPRFAFDATGFEDARAAGRGRLGAHPFALPIRFVAKRVTGVGDVAGGILADLSAEGVLHVTASALTGEGLRLASDKISGKLALFVDLVTGRFVVDLSGGLARYLIPGLGVVDVLTELKVVPDARGVGIVSGRGHAWVRRFDNAFLRGLAGGLPTLETNLVRGADGVLHLSGLVLTAPGIRLAGSGVRRRDGTFQLTGGGTQTRYGAFTLALDGDISRPKLDIVLAAPAPALGLAGVRLLLDPTPQGFAYRAAGGSTLGPFTSAGTILTPSDAPAAIAVAALDVSGTHLGGALRSLPDGLAGTLAAAGGGFEGALVFVPKPGTVQGIEIRLDAAGATLGGVAATGVRRGRLDASLLLRPDGTAADVTIAAQGLRRGGISLARLAANLKLDGGRGTVRASFAGSRGRAFAFQTQADIAPGTIRVNAQGTIDRRPLLLVQPAVLTREGESGGGGWRLASTALTFAGGSATIGGRFGGSGGNALDASLAAMPLTVLDVFQPGLDLGGSASGTLAYAQAGAGLPPQGHAELTVRGLTRAGLVVSSTPVDVGIAARLSGDALAARAVAASGGKVIGRAQARLAPLPGGGDLATRLAGAPLFAQLRYTGPADTLWRLSGVESIDLSGPLAVGADIAGTLDSPVIRGSLATEAARLESGVTGTVIDALRARGSFGGSKLVIDSFAGTTRGGGTLAGRATFDFAAAHGLGIDTAAEATRALLLDRDELGATVTGPIAIRSDGAGGTISGDVRLDRSHYRLGRAAAAAIPRLGVREINRPADEQAVGAAPVPWRLDLHADARNQLAVSGLGLDSEWRAKLDLSGDVENPRILGRADLVRGSYEFAGRRFDLDRGAIRFTGNVPVDPVLDITAQANLSGLDATIHVSGTGLQPTIDFTSVPALPQDELLSRLLFGTSITNLSAPEALQLAAAVAGLQNGGTGINPINAVRRAVGLDRLRILPADVTTGQKTSVAAGKYIGHRTYVELVTDGQGYSATNVEFQLTRWLSLLSTISTIGRQSANVRVSKDY